MYITNFNAAHLQHMLELQDAAQTKLMGKEWLDADAVPDVNFPAAISDELGELANHMDFKWWKSGEIDIRQAKMELVDMFHFIMSEIMQQQHAALGVEFGCFGRPQKNELRKQAIAMAGAAITQGIGVASANIMKDDPKSGENMLSVINKKLPQSHRLKRLLSTLNAMNVLLDLPALSALEHITSGGVKIDMTVAERHVAAVEMFVIAMSLLDMNFAELYLLYIGKNALNLFRWDNGYKDGTYIKQWSTGAESREDNEVMHAYVDTLLKLDNLDPTDDYQVLITKHLAKNYEVAKANAKAA